MVLEIKKKKLGFFLYYLHRCHVIEGMVQFLTDGFVLQFLCIQLICTKEGQVQRKRGNAHLNARRVTVVMFQRMYSTC